MWKILPPAEQVIWDKENNIHINSQDRNQSSGLRRGEKGKESKIVVARDWGKND